jgi:hypothetical protein
MLDLSTGARARPLSRRVCSALAERYAPGPLYLSFDY